MVNGVKAFYFFVVALLAFSCGRFTLQQQVSSSALSVPTTGSTSNVQSNQTRSTAQVMALRLSALFPSTDPTQITNGSNSLANALGQADDLTSFITTPSDSTGAQGAFRDAATAWCDNAPGSDNTLFSTQNILLTGETLPSDPVTQLAFAGARNGWLYPVAATDTTVTTLATLYNQVIASKGTQAQALQAMCLGVLLAPQFWLGIPGKYEVIRRIALDIGQRPPTFKEFDQYNQGTLTVTDYIAGIQTEPGYLSSVKTWHQNWLGTMDFTKYRGTAPPRGDKTHDAWYGASMFAGQYFIARAPSTSGNANQSIPVMIPSIENADEVGMLTDTGSCTDTVQAFDPTTAQIQWEQQDSKGNWWAIGGWQLIDGTWQQYGGTSPVDGKTPTTLADIVNAPLTTGSKTLFYYPSGNLAGLAPFPATNRRVRRFTTASTTLGAVSTTSSPATEQNGISLMYLWWSGQPVYVCNSFDRFIATCAYRGSTQGVPGTGKIPTPNIPILLGNAEVAGYGWTAASGNILQETNFNGQFGVDSLAHPQVLEGIKCSIDATKYPAGNKFQAITKNGNADPVANVYSTGNSSTANDVAINVEMTESVMGNEGSIAIPAATMAKYPSLQAEAREINSIYTDITNEPMNLVAQIVQDNMDYRSLLTADWTVGHGALDLFYRTQAQYLAAYPPGLPNAPGTSAYDDLITIKTSSYPNIPASWFASSMGQFPENSSFPNDTDYLFDGASGSDNPAPVNGLTPRPMSGVLTQAAWLAPIGYKLRALSAAIFRTFTCSEVNTFAPNAAQAAIQLKYVPTHEAGGQEHVDPNGVCYYCHINVDPLAAALSTGFLEMVAVPATTPTLYEEALLPRGELKGFAVQDTPIGFTYGVMGQSGSPSQGALFGQEITGGIREVGQVLANNPMFTSCAVQQAFQGVFGRQPIGPDDQALIQSLSQSWPQAGYNYNQLVRELVTSPVYLRRN